MTTIAFDGEVIAYDSRETAGSLICDEDCNKRRTANGVNFFISGRSGDESLIIEAYLNAPQDSYPKEVSQSALIVDGDKVFEAGISRDEGFTCVLVRRGLVTAIGSGSHHALTAMDCGLSAKEAVKMAAKRDTYTGGKIRTFKV